MEMIAFGRNEFTHVFK